MEPLRDARPVLQTLSRELARLETALDALPVAYYQADAGDRVLLASEELRRLAPEATEGRRVGDSYADPRDRERLLARLDAEGGEASAIVRLRSGVIVEERARRRDADGMALVEGVLYDVTEQVRFERELDRYARLLDSTNRELRRSVDALEMFTYGVSHDLKAPVRGIVAYLAALEEDLASAGVPVPPDAADHVRKARESARLMDDMIRGLLEVARLQKLPTEGTADAETVLDDVLGALAHEIRTRNAHVRREPLPRVPVAPELLRAVLLNLVGNAIKFGNDPPVVRVEAAEGEAEWTFSVTDNGPGVPPGFRDRVFLLFVRAPGARAEGSGAGLAIVRAAVLGWGGRAWVEDAPEGGARFSFTVPKRPAGAA